MLENEHQQLCMYTAPGKEERDKVGGGGGVNANKDSNLGTKIHW